MASGNSAFNLQGSGGNSGLLYNSSNGTTQTSTPAFAVQKPNTAINLAYGGKPTVPTGKYTSDSSVAFNTPTQPKTAGLLNIPAPVKKQTVTNTDGSTHTVEYHAPEKTTPAKVGTSVAEADKNDGLPTPAQPTYPGVIKSIVDTSNGNKAIGDKAAQIADEFGQKIADVGQKGAMAGAGYSTTGTSPVAEGNAAVIANTTANEQSALAKGEEAALQGTGQQLTAQGQTQTGLKSAGDLTQPVQVSPGTALVNPQNGQEQYSGLGGLTGLGIANENIATGQKYQGQAADLTTNLTKLDTIGNQVVAGMGTAGFNPFNTPIANDTFANYFTNKNPSAKTSIMAGLAEIKNTVSGVIASVTGLNPTEVGNTVNSYDFTQLNPQQLNDFLLNMKQYGQSNLQALQQGAIGAYGANSGGKVTPYVGPTANPGVLTTGTPNSTTEAGIATGASAVEGTVKGIFNKLGDMAGGVVGGVAAKMFGL